MILNIIKQNDKGSCNLIGREMQAPVKLISRLIPLSEILGYFLGFPQTILLKVDGNFVLF